MKEYESDDLPPGGISGFSQDSFRWALRRIGDVVDLHYGKALVEDDRDPGPVPVYGSNGVTGSHSEALQDGPTVVLGRKGQGHLGVKWCEEPFWVIDTAYYTSFDRDWIHPRFFYYFADQMGLNHLKVGTSNPSLQRDVFCDQLIPLPPLPVQRRIADILGALDDKIELNRRMNETLEEMAQTLYRHWFVDFGPFQDREFKDTEELRPIPEGWEVAPLETIVNIELDNIDPQDHPEEEFDYYSFSAYDEDQYPEVEIGGEIGSRKSLVKRKKVMVSRLNPSDYRIWTVYPNGERRGITSTEFIHFVPTRSSLWGYLNCHLRSDVFKSEFRRHASGTTGSRQRVRRRTPNEFKTVIPPENVLNEFGEKVNPIWDLIHSNREENQTLAETRDYLLPKLISGEIEVEAAEEAVGTIE